METPLMRWLAQLNHRYHILQPLWFRIWNLLVRWRHRTPEPPRASTTDHASR